MDRRVIIPVTIILSSIIALFLFNRFGHSMILLMPLGLIAILLASFSRGILIFFTMACLISIQSWFVIATFRKSLDILLTIRWVLFGLFCLHAFGDIFLGRTVRKIKSFDFIAIIFIVYAFLSALYSSHPKETIERTITISVLYLSVFWIIWKYAYIKGPDRIVSIMLQVMLLVCIGSFLMIFIGPIRPFTTGRFTGIVYNPNSLGIICAIHLPLSLWQYLETKRKPALFLFILMLLALLLTSARGSMTASVISLGYFIYARSQKYRPLIFSLAISLILILIWAIETLLKEFFAFYIRADNIPMLGGRLHIWPVALQLITEKPFFGYGFGTEEFLFVLKKHTMLGYHIYLTHNSYLGMTLQLGVVGAIIFFLPLFILSFKELFSKRTDEAVPLLRYALRATLIAGLICAFYESWIYVVGNPVAFPYWIAVMLLVYYRYQENTALEST